MGLFDDDLDDDDRDEYIFDDDDDYIMACTRYFNIVGMPEDTFLAALKEIDSSRFDY